MSKQLKLISMLVSLGLLSGCGTTKTFVETAELCKSWRHQTVSKNDVITDETASGIEGNNKARPAWGCEYGKDKPKGS